MAKKKVSLKAPSSKATSKSASAKKQGTKKQGAKKQGAGKAKPTASVKAAETSEELSVAITFRAGPGQPGVVSLGSVASPEQLKNLEPTESNIRQVLSVMQQHGFELSSRGKYSVVVRGTKSEYEKLFGTLLSPMSIESAPISMASAKSVYFPAAGAPWNPKPEISQLIDDAYIQWPHIYMNSQFSFPPSALPPRVNYFHLRVPGDVAMLLNAARAHREGFTGRGVRVAMIDSGFNHSHPYFQEMGYRSSVVLAQGASNPATDRNGHGTGESANLFAVAPDVNFIGIKLDRDDNRQGASLLTGFNEAVRQNPQIISVSLGFDLANQATRVHLASLPNSLKALEVEIQAAVASGIVVVFSAGNGHVAFPGMMPDVISAGGVFVGEDGKMQASDYSSGFKSKIYPGRIVPDFSGLVGLASNGANYIELPLQAGCELDQRSDGTGTNDGWGIFSGTSASAPQLAGVCALLLQKNPGLTPSDIKQILRRTSRDVINGKNNAMSSERVAISASTGPDSATGSGLVDAFAALRQV